MIFINYKIRWAEEKDSKQLGTLHSMSWRMAYKGIVPDEVLESITPEKREDYFRTAITNKKEETAVIIANGQVLGFVTLGKCRDEGMPSDHGEIWGIYMSPDYWGKRFGSIIFDWGLEELRSRGFKKVSLWVLEDNLRARIFYEKHGFIYDGAVNVLNIGKVINEVRYIKEV